MTTTKLNWRTLLNHRIKLLSHRYFYKVDRKPPWNVLFFGSDDFSLLSLKSLCKEYRSGTTINNLEVVTTIKGNKANPIKRYVDEEKLTLHKWPISLNKNEYHVGLVVSFGCLIPEGIIEKFQYGMLNVHASILPRWRGAAPIIHALSNGDSETGITIMRVRPKKFDIGEIVLQESIPIPPTIRMPELYNQLGVLGSENLLKVLRDLPKYLNRAKPQPNSGITYAPKITPEFACIKWDLMSSYRICNLSRALFGVYHLTTTWKGTTPIKLINILDQQENPEQQSEDRKNTPGFAEYDKNQNLIKILCSDGRFISVKNMGVSGKRLMTAKDFYNGFMHKEPIENRKFK